MAIDNIIAAGIQPTTPLMSPMQTMGGLMQLRGQMADQSLREAQMVEVRQRQQNEKLRGDQINLELKDANNFAEIQKDAGLMRKFGETGDVSMFYEKGISPKFIEELSKGRGNQITRIQTQTVTGQAIKQNATNQMIATGDGILAPMAGGKPVDIATANSRYQGALARLKELALLRGDDPAKLPGSITSLEQLQGVMSGLNLEAGLFDAGLKRTEETAKRDKAIADVAKATADAAVAVKVNTGTSPLGVSEVQKQQLAGEDIDRQMTAKYRDAELKQAAERIGIDRQRLFQDKEETHLTPEALGKMAEMFATTGTMPTLGQGKNAAAMRSQIINQAAKDYPNVQFATNQAAFQANKASLNLLQKNYDAVTAFEETAGKNLNTFLQSAGKIVDTGVPWLNKPLRALDMKLLGSSDQAAANAARTTALTEIAKVLNSANATGVLSDSARHEVEQLIGGDATMKQVVAAANILKQDMGNRKQSYQEQIKAINNRISGKQEETAPASGPVKIATEADFNNLKSGTEFIDPDGVHRRKP